MNQNLKVTGKWGLIGCFDILGYTEVLAHNEITTVLGLLRESIGETISKIEKIGSTFPADSPKKKTAERLLRDLDRIVFSDTVILAFPLAPDPALIDAENLTFFIHASLFFLQAMFLRGLPLRGAIHVGEYFIGEVPNISKDRVCAGRGIISAYEEAKKHDWSGCVLTSDAEEQMKKISETYPQYDHLKSMLIQYSVPLKKGGEEPRWTINYLFPKSQRVNLIPASEVRALVINKFSAHKKIIDEKARSKLLNTEIFLTFGRVEYDRHFGQRGE